MLPRVVHNQLAEMDFFLRFIQRREEADFILELSLRLAQYFLLILGDQLLKVMMALLIANAGFIFNVFLYVFLNIVLSIPNMFFGGNSHTFLKQAMGEYTSRLLIAMVLSSCCAFILISANFFDDRRLYVGLSMSRVFSAIFCLPVLAFLFSDFFVATSRDSFLDGLGPHLEELASGKRIALITGGPAFFFAHSVTRCMEGIIDHQRDRGL